jgi:prepilin-type processing-associated H-X9-DG protein/prepilin-type N-terminal cleavage/methylation domain-containing protein
VSTNSTVPFRKRHEAFTLVELLVVIGIIGILMSILLPVLGGARKKAQAIQCAANLRTLGQAWIMYANANKRVSVPARMPTSGAAGGVYYTESGAQYRPRWYELLGDVIGQPATRTPRTNEDDAWQIENPVFLCPAVSDWNNSRNYPYGYNYQFLGNARYKPDGSFINYPVKSGRIKAAQTVMAADCIGTASGKPKLKRTAYYADGTKDIFGRGNKAWALDPPRLTANSDMADPQRRAPENRSGPDPRHSRKANVAFCDGHVELMSLADMGYVVNPDESVAAMDARASNRIFSGSGRDDDPPSVR